MSSIRRRFSIFLGRIGKIFLNKDDCYICGNSLYNFCVQCKRIEENKLIEDLNEIEQKCPLIWTSCGHYFHSHCFDENNSKCPECGQTVAWTSKLNKGQKLDPDFI